MNPLSSLVFVVVVALTAALGAPTDGPIAGDIIHQNALDAQVLNGEFQRMNETDPCNTGQTACIGDAPAQCKFGSWKVGRCSQTQSCFALPKSSTRGTFIACVSEAEAVSFFDQAGVKGGPVSNATGSSSILLPSAANSTNAVAGVITVTVTVPVTAVSTSTSISVATIDAAQAMGVLQSAFANGAVVAEPTRGPISRASRSVHCTMTDGSSAVSRATQPTSGVGFNFKRSIHGRRSSRYY
ncbi:hypothetical protein BDY19DRAFT_997496 [Irpex rosettiformis]|uniref:Uncharacterized protein n=1 Tax=Irpex rosettiformis TaxID=378272 RepID=A0ACB8TS00_9APHY|nr:hypothetical protein BDY19DRAFT_997496 [Irpex rosettiformis]